jgi:hypothetical protein
LYDEFCSAVVAGYVSEETVYQAFEFGVHSCD